MEITIMKDIKSIINEEIALLTESYIHSDDNFIFKQTITNSSFSNYDTSAEYDLDITESNILVKWRVKFWLNNFGIENLVIEIDGIEGQYLLEEYDKISDELVNSTAKNINDIKWNFENSDVVLTTGGSLYIDSLEFDFKTNTCTVKF
jgi:hypothetical protein